MLSKNYRRLTEAEQQTAIDRLAEQTHADKNVLRKVLDKMNPVMELVDGKLKLFRNTLLRIDRNVKKATD